MTKRTEHFSQNTWIKINQILSVIINASHRMLSVFTAMLTHPGGRKSGSWPEAITSNSCCDSCLFCSTCSSPRCHPHPSPALISSGRVCEACVGVVGLTALSGLRPFLISSQHRGILSWQAANTHTYKYQFTSGGQSIRGGRGVSWGQASTGLHARCTSPGNVTFRRSKQRLPYLFI